MSNPEDPQSQTDRHLATAHRFDAAGVAERYAYRKNAPTARNRREWVCIRRGLAGLPPGAEVLDLPCGAGRLIAPLRELGYRVTAADYSEHMLATARQHYLAVCGISAEACDVDFVRQDVMATGFDDGSFDAVICNRLLHHYPTPGLRRRALAEMRRISRGVVRLRTA